MDSTIFTQDDLKEISSRGISPEKVLNQIAKFKKGMPYTIVVKPCIVNDGVTVLDDTDIVKYSDIFSDAQKNGRCTKFVPASGAASRMFKLLLGAAVEPENKGAAVEADNTLSAFISELNHYAFYDELKNKMHNDGIVLDECINKGQVKTILEYLLLDKGLDLSSLPKGLIPFHKYADHSRTPFEEHLVEARNYIRDKNGKISVHFTVSPQHEEKIKAFIESVLPLYEREGDEFVITYSCQKLSTDTIAVDLDDNPFRDENSTLLFRPGGHGALIENLSDLAGDIIFIKNIDNIAADRHKSLTFKYKKALGGYLVSLQKEIFSHLKILMEESADDNFIRGVFQFIRDRLSVIPTQDILNSTPEEKKQYLVDVLNRPLRVCGMVKNTGDPGGGPFWVKHPDGEISIQVVESSQIDLKKSDQKDILQSATHFNPVDLVCGVKDLNGKPFDLNKYIDHDAGFISVKSKNGRELKAMELPGLWNGSMAFWNTVFVEVPAGTFSPVKTVFDLMNDDHRM